MDIRTPNSRNTDPMPSHLAGEHITATGNRARHIDIVTRAVEEYPGYTARELSWLIGRDKSLDQETKEALDYVAVGKRLSDAKGVQVRVGGYRPCSLKPGRDVSVWYAK